MPVNQAPETRSNRSVHDESSGAATSRCCDRGWGTAQRCVLFSLIARCLCVVSEQSDERNSNCTYLLHVIMAAYVYAWKTIIFCRSSFLFSNALLRCHHTELNQTLNSFVNQRWKWPSRIWGPKLPFLAENNLRLNKSKSEEVLSHDSRRRKLKTLPPPLTDITWESSLKILGVTFSNNLSVSDHIRRDVSESADAVCSASTEAPRAVWRQTTASLPSCCSL